MKELAAGLQFARGWSLAVSFCDTFDPTYDVLPLSMGPVCHYREDLDVPAATLLNRPGFTGDRFVKLPAMLVRPALRSIVLRPLQVEC